MIEFNDQDSAVFDETIDVLKQYLDFESQRIKKETMVLLPGFEIYLDRRKIYRDRREINLTTEEYGLLCMFVANKGRVLTYDQIYQKICGFTGRFFQQPMCAGGRVLL